MNGFRSFCLYSLARASIFMLERRVEECDKNGNKRMEFVVGGGRKLVESLLQSEERRLITHGSRIIRLLVERAGDIEKEMARRLVAAGIYDILTDVSMAPSDTTESGENAPSQVLRIFADTLIIIM